MSLKRKDYQAQQQQQGLRVAAGEPHLVSLGGGRLSTAVTIHHLPIGDLTIGSSPACGIVLNGTGVLPVHCTVYRNETDEILLVPEPEGRTLVDGNRVTEEVNLRQGAMLTVGKANYMRFNNPAEAELIRSTMGSNDRISMPQLDFTSNDSSPTAEDDENRNILNNKFVESQASKSRVSELLEKFTRNEFGANMKNGQKETAAVNGKYSSYTKNLNQNANNYANGQVSAASNGSVKLNNNQTAASNGNGSAGANGDILATLPNMHISNKSNNSYDRYPKRGGGLQVFPMNGLNEQMNNNSGEPTMNNGYANSLEVQRQRAHVERLREQEVSRAEQDRLEEIIQLCAEYERQNSSSSNMTASPIVQNRIKTNGSLPRDKKSPFGSEINSPLYNDCKNGQVFFPSDVSVEKTPKKGSTGYENVHLVTSMRRIEVSSRYENISDVVGDTHEYPLTPQKKYVPQSPRTKIRTNCQASPKPVQKSVEQERKNEYDLLMKSFEDRQVQEEQQQKYSEAEKRIIANVRLNGSMKSNGCGEKADGKSLATLKRSRNEVLRRVRELKTEIADLQRQEDEVLRELDMEKALVSGELATEKESLFQMEGELSSVQQKIHRLEAQRKANRVMQETQQKKLQQTIEIKENEVSGLEKLFEDHPMDKSLREQLDDTIGSMENDKKMFEDLEFQYLEEETDWLSAREELHSEVKHLAVAIEEKRAEIMVLENQKVKDTDIACTDTKILEKSLFNMLKDLERGREELKNIDNRIFQLSDKNTGTDRHNEISDSEDEDLIRNAFETGQNEKNLMSNSLFGSEEILKQKPSQALMSKSMNENMFFNNLETPDFSSTPKKPGTSRVIVDIHEDITNMVEKNHDRLKLAENEEFVITRDENVQDPLLKLKYNVSSPPLEKSQSVADVSSTSGSKINLNLSLEADDFEVNPMIERVPSQDDIDRISKVTSDAPISTQGASFKVKESIREIERNRQLLLTQQGSHVIEHERQKMNELKKKSHDEARAQYLRLQSTSRSDSESSGKNELVLEGEPPVTPEEELLKDGKPASPSNTPTNNNQRHSQPDFGDGLQQQHQPPLRPLSEAGSEQHYENGANMSPDRLRSHAASDKQCKSTNDIFMSTGHHPVTVQEIYRSSGGLNNSRLSNNNPDLIQDSSHRNSGISTHSGDSGTSNLHNGSSGRNSNTDSLSRLVSGGRRNLPKVQRPLTRYLPIMSADLDLKQHIETAGHQINLCPHVTVDSTSCRGYLHKLGATFHGWSRRWFVLDRQKGALIYYSDKSEKKPRGGSYFTTIDEVYLDHLNTSKSGRPHCTFIVKTKKRSYHLQAASDAAARIWIDAIITGAQGNMDYL